MASSATSDSSAVQPVEPVGPQRDRASSKSAATSPHSPASAAASHTNAAVDSHGLLLGCVRHDINALTPQQKQALTAMRDKVTPHQPTNQSNQHSPSATNQPAATQAAHPHSPHTRAHTPGHTALHTTQHTTPLHRTPHQTRLSSQVIPGHPMHAD